MTSKPSNLKIISEQGQMNIEWQVSETNGMGPQYLYVKNVNSALWGNPIILPGSARSYIYKGVSGEYKIRLETFEYKGSANATSSIIHNEEDNKVIIACNDGSGWGNKTSSALISAGIKGCRSSGSAETSNGYSALNAGFSADKCAIITKSTGVAEEAISKGIKIIEFGNEQYAVKGMTAPLYASEFVKWAKILENKQAILLFNGYGGSWIEEAVNAQPSLKKLIGGLSFHPYGGIGRSTTGVFGKGHEEGEGAMEIMHTKCIDLGIENSDIYITEWGQQMEGNENVQAETTKAFMNYVTKLPYVKFFAYYQSHDDSTGQWGLFDSNSNSRKVLSVVSEFAKNNG